MGQNAPRFCQVVKVSQLTEPLHSKDFSDSIRQDCGTFGAEKFDVVVSELRVYNPANSRNPEKNRTRRNLRGL